MDDELLRFFERCRNYVEGVEKNRTALQEVEKFKQGEEVEELRRRTARRLGVHQHLLTPGQTHTHAHAHIHSQLCVLLSGACPSVSSADLLEAAFFICSYELSIKSVHSPWCFLFDKDDAKVHTLLQQTHTTLPHVLSV